MVYCNSRNHTVLTIEEVALNNHQGLFSKELSHSLKIHEINRTVDVIMIDRSFEVFMAYGYRFS